MSLVKELYNEWRNLKNESLSWQRAGIDDNMTETGHQRDVWVYNRIKELEAEMFPLLTEREVLTFDNTPSGEAEKMQDKYYEGGSYLVNWVKTKEDIKYDSGSGTVSGEIVYAKKPL